ncbi:MAG: radical SAM family heme chaperone HemW [Mycobacteriales bacterium]
MPSTPPPGEPVPDTGPVAPGTSAAPFGVYVHVPFCATRCGYCDFNTYTAGELGGATGPDAWAEAARTEVRLAAELLDAAPARTVFVGGGTPTLLEPALLGSVLAEVRDAFGPAPEVTVEANPETVTPPLLDALLEIGVNRLSLGMQSAVPHVLAALDRVHTPGRAVEAARLARAHGFGQVSLDLIYGGPGESDDDWRRSVETALSAEPTHVSAYALVVEDGTALARKVSRGEAAAPDDDVLAGRYEVADALFEQAGLPWYEVSNWGEPCRHNLGYWRSHDWWGIGPGAHSHVGGTRWWNVRHPAAYAAALAGGRQPAQAREVLTASQRRDERILLGVRLAEGLALAELPDPGPAGQLAADGLVDLAGDRLVLTRRGRLLADTVVRALVP